MVERADREVRSRAGASAGGRVEAGLRHVRGPGASGPARGTRPEIEVVHPWDRVPWWLAALLGCAAIAVLSLPRALGVGSGPADYGWYVSGRGRTVVGPMLDQELYLQLVDAFRGLAPRVDVAPFTDRSLGPWLAHLLPFDAAPSLLLVNVGLLCAGCVAVARLVHELTGDRGRVLVAVALWSVAFPVLWYTATFVDAAAVGLAALGLLAVYRRWTVVAALLVVASIWAKETAVVLVAVAASRELLLVPGGWRRWARAGGWVAVGLFGYATRGALAGPAASTFAPWFPADAASGLRWIAYNASRPGGVLALVLTAAPAVAALWLWLRRGRDQLLERSDSVPLLLGVAVSLVLAAWSVVTALLDGRVAWTALPTAAVLLACWRDPRPVTARPGRARRLARAATVGAVALLVVVAVVATGLMLRPADPPFVADLSPRFARVPEQPPGYSEVRGWGDGSIPVADVAPDGEPVTVTFRADGPVRLRGPGLDWMADTPGARAGTVLVDAAAPAPIGIEAHGGWEASVRPAAAGPFAAAGGLQAWTGTGPAVLLHATGVHSAYRMRLESTDPAARVRLTGRCRLGDCGPPQRGELRVPVGTEAVSVETVGPWRLVPIGGDATDPPERLPGTTR